MEEKNAKSVALDLERLMNSFSCTPDTEEFVGEMLNLHRTLNQVFTGKIVLRFIQRMAENYRKERYDGRNELSCKICNLLWEALKNNEYGYEFRNDTLPNLPMI